MPQLTLFQVNEVLVVGCFHVTVAVATVSVLYVIEMKKISNVVYFLSYSLIVLIMVN